jgi:hypothetical protein
VLPEELQKSSEKPAQGPRLTIGAKFEDFIQRKVKQNFDGRMLFQYTNTLY